jgi:hypothetical protein
VPSIACVPLLLNTTTPVPGIALTGKIPAEHRATVMPAFDAAPAGTACKGATVRLDNPHPAPPSGHSCPIRLDAATLCNDARHQQVGKQAAVHSCTRPRPADIPLTFR